MILLYSGNLDEQASVVVFNCAYVIKTVGSKVAAWKGHDHHMHIETKTGKSYRDRTAMEACLNCHVDVARDCKHKTERKRIQDRLSDPSYVRPPAPWL